MPSTVSEQKEPNLELIPQKIQWFAEMKLFAALLFFVFFNLAGLLTVLLLFVAQGLAPFNLFLLLVSGVLPFVLAYLYYSYLFKRFVWQGYGAIRTALVPRLSKAIEKSFATVESYAQERNRNLRQSVQEAFDKLLAYLPESLQKTLKQTLLSGFLEQSLERYRPEKLNVEQLKLSVRMAEYLEEQVALQMHSRFYPSASFLYIGFAANALFLLLLAYQVYTLFV